MQNVSECPKYISNHACSRERQRGAARCMERSSKEVPAELNLEGKGDGRPSQHN
jgi:hypothetical protein